MTKENVYDEQINPLVHQIIGICKEHNIALLLSAQLQDEDDETLYSQPSSRALTMCPTKSLSRR